MFDSGSAAACCFPDEAQATAESIICIILAATEKQCAALEKTRNRTFVSRQKSAPDADVRDEDLRLIRNVGDEPEFEFWGYSLTTSFLNEATHKLERKVMPHLWGRQTSVAFGWVYRGQFDAGKIQ